MRLVDHRTRAATNTKYTRTKHTAYIAHSRVSTLYSQPRAEPGCPGAEKYRTTTTATPSSSGLLPVHTRAQRRLEECISTREKGEPTKIKRHSQLDTPAQRYKHGAHRAHGDEEGCAQNLRAHSCAATLRKRATRCWRVRRSAGWWIGCGWPRRVSFVFFFSFFGFVCFVYAARIARAAYTKADIILNYGCNTSS